MLAFPKSDMREKAGGWKHSTNFLRRIREEMELTGICVIDNDDIDDILTAIEAAYNKFESYQGGL